MSVQFSSIQHSQLHSLDPHSPLHKLSRQQKSCIQQRRFYQQATNAHKQSGIGSAPGTFGELLQGALAGETNNFLVTFPINRAATVAFIPNEDSRDVTTFPSGKSKSVQLVRQLLDNWGIETGGLLMFSQQLPEGKGLASSSADMVASARAVADCYGFSPNEAFLSTLLRDIEPTDGVMYDECVAFFHRRCELIAKLGSLPPLVVVGIDEGNTINTVEFNQRADAHSESEIEEYSQLLRILSTAVGKKDVRAIGRVSTRSAEINQKYNPKQYLNLAIAIADAIEALGVVVAHSGTYVGVLLDPNQEKFNRQFNQAKLAISLSARPVEVFRSV